MVRPVSVDEISLGAPHPAVDVSLRRDPLGSLETVIEHLLFGSRWLLAPLYLGLVGGLVAILVKFVQAFWEIFRHLTTHSYSQVTLGVLGLLDLTLLANLVLMVVFAGYENFVSKIGAAKESEDRPHWMGQVDFSGLKMKLIGSIVALSVIGLLQDFINADTVSHATIRWQIWIHLTFLLSGVLFATMDYIAERRQSIRGGHDSGA